MRRLGAVVAIALAGFIAAIVVFSLPGRQGCPLKADKDGSYAGRFVGPVSVDETTHEIVLTRNGRRLTGVEVCVNTEMVGMTGMGYSAAAPERSPGRYVVPFRFQMQGDYRTNIVAKEITGEIGIPLTVRVGGGGMNTSDYSEQTTTSGASAENVCATRRIETNGAYASTFEGDVTMNAKKHVLVVTHDGQPVAGASVCVDTAMVGMTSMHYSARGREVAPGRYEVPVKFAMQGTYRGNVVTEVSDRAISVPLTVKVGAASAMKDDDKMSTTTSGAMDDEDGP